MSPVNYADLVARAVRILNSNGIMHKSGHVAARDAEHPYIMWINSRPASRSSVTANDIVRADLRTGEQIGEGDELPSEFHIHRAIFNRRPDVGAIVHSHPDYVVALSVADQPLVPVTVDGGFLAGPAPIFDDPGHINTPERGNLLAAKLGDRAAVVLRGHGIAVTGRNVEEALTRIVMVERNAHTQYLALAIGKLHPLSEEEVAAINQTTSSDKALRKAFDYEEETARRAGAFTN